MNCCEYCNELSDFVNDLEIIDHGKECQLLKKTLLFGLECDVHLYTAFFILFFFFFVVLAAPSRAVASSFLRFFRDHTQRHTTVGRTPLDE